MSKPDEIAISRFKATCLAVLEEVRRTGRPVRVTRFGKPVADIVAPRPDAASPRRLGFMEGQLGDYEDEAIIAPADTGEFVASTLAEWDAAIARAPTQKSSRRRPKPR